jgi:hypothetical protein
LSAAWFARAAQLGTGRQDLRRFAVGAQTGGGREKYKDSCEFSRAKRNSVALKQMCLLRLKPYPSTDLKLNI